MKIEVRVGPETYVFNCDKVIDGTKSRVSGGGVDEGAKLVIVKNIQKEVGKTAYDTPKTIAVFNIWTFWRIIDDKAKK